MVVVVTAVVVLVMAPVSRRRNRHVVMLPVVLVVGQTGTRGLVNGGATAERGAGEEEGVRGSTARGKGCRSRA